MLRIGRAGVYASRVLPQSTVRGPIHQVVKHSYHSYEYPDSGPFSPTETAILSAGLAQVPTHGFTSAALTTGARNAGYLDITTNLFPEGAVALIKYHLVTRRLALSEHFPSPFTASSTPPPSADEGHPQNPPRANPSKPSSSGSIPDLIHRITLHRLHANKNILPHWQSALAILSTPPHIPLAVRELARLADEILFLAGSKTVTGAWYTDRAGLSAIYASAELFMTQDSSKDFTETEKFLQRRLAEAATVRGGLGFFNEWMRGQAGGLVDGLRSKGVWI